MLNSWCMSVYSLVLAALALGGRRGVMLLVIAVFVVVLNWGGGLLARAGGLGSMMSMVVLVMVGLVLVVLAVLALGLGVRLVELVEHFLSLLHNLEKEDLGSHLGIGRAGAVEDLVRGLDTHGTQLDLSVDHVVLIL